MKTVSRYNDNHFKFYLEKIKNLNAQNKPINLWVKSLSEHELLIWIRIVKLIKEYNRMQYHNMLPAITHIIHLFLIELDIDINMVTTFNNDFVLELVKRFGMIILYEYEFRKNFVKEEREYTLLKGMRWNTHPQ